jgi:uncharacterized peroxidase-related enzyme
MNFIDSVPEAAAEGPVAEMYARVRDASGRVPNHARALSLQPDVYTAWQALNAAIKASMDLRRYELVTLAAARCLRSSYCALAHGSVLVETFLEPGTVRAIARDEPAGELEPVDLAVMDLTAQVVRDATAITQEDIDRLRDLGLADEDILSVILAAAARCFFSKALDAVGAAADASYAELEPDLRAALTVGRAISAE